MNMYVVFRHAETEFRKVFTKDLSGSRKINLWLLYVLNITGVFIATLCLFIVEEFPKNTIVGEILCVCGGVYMFYILIIYTHIY